MADRVKAEEGHQENGVFQRGAPFSGPNVLERRRWNRAPQDRTRTGAEVWMAVSQYQIIPQLAKELRGLKGAGISRDRDYFNRPERGTMQCHSGVPLEEVFSPKLDLTRGAR